MAGTFIVPFHLVSVYFVDSVSLWGAVDADIRMPPDTTYGSRIVLHLVIVKYNVRVGMKMARQEVCFIAIQ